MLVSKINFTGMPKNYGIVDKFITRSAQPKEEDFKWLKYQGVTDVFNFRTMFDWGIDFDEKRIVEKLGMKYHNIKSYTSKPSEDNVKQFFTEIEKVIQNKGKAHIHCKAGADRTGMYAFLYKMVKGIGTFEYNKKEWLRFGHNKERFPNLMSWAENYIKKIGKI